MAPVPPPSLFEKIGTYTVLAKTMLVALTQLLTSPIRSGPRPSDLFKDCMYKALRYQLGNLTLTQETWMSPRTEANYLDFAKKERFQPDTLALDSGCKAHWLGNKGAEKVIVYYHGGGYVLPASPGHIKWLFDLTQDLSESFSICAILLGYTCAPEAQYPGQLCQAAELLDHLITKEGRKPGDIIIAGDSAGGNLALGLLSHILHPHPEVPIKIKLKEPLRAAVLISPWVNFDVNQPSFDRNVQSDILCKAVGQRWADAFRGNAELDNYNQPILADSGWFSELGAIVSDILVWGGGGEVLIDSIDQIANQLKGVYPKTEYIVQHNAGHEDFIIEKFLGYKNKAEGSLVIEKWISSRL